MANYTTYSDFYKVSFITTKSINIPKLLKQTGGLIVMSNTDDFRCTVNPEHGVHHPKSLFECGMNDCADENWLVYEEKMRIISETEKYPKVIIKIKPEKKSGSIF